MFNDQRIASVCVCVNTYRNPRWPDILSKSTKTKEPQRIPLYYDDTIEWKIEFTGIIGKFSMEMLETIETENKRWSHERQRFKYESTTKQRPHCFWWHGNFNEVSIPRINSIQLCSISRSVSFTSFTLLFLLTVLKCCVKRNKERVRVFLCLE